MKVTVDANEPEDRFEMAVDSFPQDWEVSRDLLDVGDYVCGNVCVEWKRDDISDIKHLENQCLRMIRKYQPQNCHVIVERSYEDVSMLFHGRAFKGNPEYGYFAYLAAELGVHVWFMGNAENGFKLMKSLFEKGNKEKKNIPMVLPIDVKEIDPVLRLYGYGFEGIGDQTAQRLKERFPIPAVLFKSLGDIHKEPKSKYQWWKENKLTWIRTRLIRMADIIYRGRNTNDTQDGNKKE